MVSQKYVPTSVARTAAYIENNPALLFKIHCLQVLNEHSYDENLLILRQGLKNMIENQARYGPFLDELSRRVGATSDNELYIKCGLGDLEF